MSKFKILSQKELDMLSGEKRKKYLKEYEDYLKARIAIELREKAEFEKIQKAKNKKRINHGMFLVAGELFNSKFAVDFLKDLSSRTRFTARHTEDLNLLMESKGLGKVIKFIPCEEPKKDKDKPKEENRETLKVEEPSSKTKEL